MIKRFFHDANVNRLYLHSVLFNIATKIKLVFGPVFLLQHGYSVVQTLLIFAGFFALRFFIRLGYLALFPYLKLRGSIILGALLTAACLPALFLATEPLFLPLYMLIFAAGETFYYTAYNTLFGFHGEAEHKGKHFSMMFCISLLAMAGAPVLSALVITSIGYMWLFGFTAALMLFSILPLLSLTDTKERFTSFKESRKDKMNKWVFGFHFSNALHETGQNLLWSIAVFLMIGSVMEFGVITTAGILLLAVLQLVIGAWVDRGGGYPLFRLGAMTKGVQAILRAFAVTTPAAIVASEGLTIGRHLMTQADTDFYNGSKVARNHLWYFYYAEGGFDAGAVIVLLITASLYAVGISIPISLVLVAIPGLMGAAYFVLRSKIGKQLARSNP
jgi:MFS family permease